MILWAGAKMVLILGLLCIGLFFTLRVLKQKRINHPMASSQSIIKLLCTQWIAPQKFISLVDIGGELFAIGISESQITLLTKIEDKERIKDIIENLEMKSLPFYQIQHYLFKNKGIGRMLLRKFHEKQIKTNQ